MEDQEIRNWNRNRNRKIDECFKSGSMIDINPPSPFSAFLEGKMDDTRSPFKKRYEQKNVVVTILFS